MASAGRISSLESVRGLAALTVCLFHACYIRYMGMPLVAKTSPLEILLNGHGAVVLFFVLSGYVLRSSLGRSARVRPFSLAFRYLVARVFRLFPVIIATSALFVSLAWALGGQPPQFGNLFRNALLLDVSINGAFWTLQVEVFGSLLVLASYLIEERFGLWPVFVATAGLLPMSFMGHSNLIFGTINSGLFYTFLVGYLVAALPLPEVKSSPYAALILCLALTAFYWAHVRGDIFKQWLLFITTLSAAIIVFIFSNDRFRNSLQWKPVRLLGALSYSYYALHPLGIELAQHLAPTIAQHDPARWKVVAALFVVSAGVAFVLSIAMNYAVERPGISVGRVITGATKRRLRLTDPTMERASGVLARRPDISS